MSVSVIVCSLIFIVSIEYSVSSKESSVEDEDDSQESSNQSWEDLFMECLSYFDAMCDGYIFMIENDKMPPCYKEALAKGEIDEEDAEEGLYQLLESYYLMPYEDQVKVDDCLIECDAVVLEHTNAEMSEKCEELLYGWYDYPAESSNEPSGEKSQEKMHRRLYRKLRHR